MRVINNVCIVINVIIFVRKCTARQTHTRSTGIVYALVVVVELGVQGPGGDVNKSVECVLQMSRDGSYMYVRMNMCACFVLVYMLCECKS